jgi:hypothetical protein
MEKNMSDQTAFIKNDDGMVDYPEKSAMQNKSIIFDLQDVKELTNSYKALLLIERSAMMELSDARAALESEKSRMIGLAYVAGAIDTKNADTRKTGETKAVEDSPGVYWLEKYAREAQQNYEQAEIDRKAVEIEISLVKAWLYSQSGLGK